MKLHRQKSYIYEHYSEDISVEKLSELVYLSPGYFSYIFKKETGDTVKPFYSELPDGAGKKTAFRYIYEDCADM